MSMWVIFRKEIQAFFNSMVGYLVISIFLVGTGLFTWIFPQTSLLNYGYAGLDTLFFITPFVYLFLIPAVTMRAFAEEKQQGTIELLFTHPLTDYQIIIGKYLACWILVIFALAPTLLYYFSIYELGATRGNIDSAATAGSYLGLILLGGVFTAIGILASALTDNQIIAFITAVFLCFILYAGFSSLANISIWSNYSFIISQLSLDFHYNALSKGLIDSRNVIYFLSYIILFLYLTKVTLENLRK